MYIRQLRVALQGKSGDALKTEEVLLNGLTLNFSIYYYFIIF